MKNKAVKFLAGCVLVLSMTGCGIEKSANKPDVTIDDLYIEKNDYNQEYDLSLVLKNNTGDSIYIISTVLQLVNASTGKKVDMTLESTGNLMEVASTKTVTLDYYWTFDEMDRYSALEPDYVVYQVSGENVSKKCNFSREEILQYTLRSKNMDH